MAEWTILGGDSLAGELREAARFIDAPAAQTIVTSGADIPAGAVALAGAALSPNSGQVASALLGFRVLEDALRMTRQGELGTLYSVFGSSRLARGTASDDVQRRALLPLLGFALTLLPQPVSRVWATASSVESQDDCWFVTLRLQDEVIVTLEALAIADHAAGDEVLIEIIGSERVARCEPTRQSVGVESLGRAIQHLPWWEDGAERLLQLIASPDPPLIDGARLRAVWDAALQSARDGQPHSFS